MLRFFRRGQGPRSCVLLHGFLGSGRNLMSLARTWSERDPSLSFWVPDLPGHGESPALPENANLDHMAESILTFVRAETPGTHLHLVGHSLGGRVAIAASRDPAIDRVSLLDIAPGPVPTDLGPGRVAAMLAALPEAAPSRAAVVDRLTAAGISLALANWLVMNLEREGDAYRWRIDRDALAAFHARTTTADLWPNVERPDSVVKHCIRGGRSEFVSDDDARRLEAAGCHVSTVEDAGHFLHVDALDRLVELLLTTG